MQEGTQSKMIVKISLQDFRRIKKAYHDKQNLKKKSIGEFFQQNLTTEFWFTNIFSNGWSKKPKGWLIQWRKAETIKHTTSSVHILQYSLRCVSSTISRKLREMMKNKQLKRVKAIEFMTTIPHTKYSSCNKRTLFTIEANAFTSVFCGKNSFVI